jgi:hypothetical protein
MSETFDEARGPLKREQDELANIKEQMQSAIGMEYPLAHPIQDPVDIKQYAPEGGWQTEQFPALTAVLIPYTCNPNLAPDPHIYLLPDGWCFIEIGNVRVAISNRGEWDKLVHMVECMWNTFERNQEQAKLAAEDSQPWVPTDDEIEEFGELLNAGDRVLPSNGKENSDDHQAHDPR